MASTLAVAALCTAGPALARDQIKVVGSSTVFPYTQAVAEEFGKKTGKKSPVVESTGTGGGMKIFCQGVGEANPDITGASRAMKKSEWELCTKNGVTDITEIQIGYDGLSVAQSKKGKPIDLTKAQTLPGARLGGSGRRQARSQSLQEVERCRQVAPRRRHHRLRPAADLRHARRFRRARHA